ncbi:MAG: hypothetical protein WBM99_07700 [Psychromonas sp.]
MKNIQFTFSLCVAIAVNVFGILIVQKDQVGFSLIAVGLALMLIAFLTKNSQQSSRVETPCNLLNE